MKSRDLGKLAVQQFKAGDRKAAQRTIEQMNAATTATHNRKAALRRAGKLGIRT